MFHWDLGIKYLHDSSFASVYTAKLANPKYSAFTSTHRRKAGTPRVVADRAAKGGRRASDGSLVIREHRERVNLSAPHVRRRFENRELARDYARRAARQNSAESAAIKAGERARPSLLRVKSSERLSFVESRLRVPNWPSRTIVVRMKSTHELEDVWRQEVYDQFPLRKNN